MKSFYSYINSRMMESSFGSNLRFLRKKEKITLEELSRSLAVSKSSLSDYETKKTFPPLDICRKLADYFHVSIDTFEKSRLWESNTTAHELNAEGNTSASVEQIRDLKRECRLKDQQIIGLKTQLKLQGQLIDSKNAELQSLRIQIQLLEERIKLLGG